MVALTATRAEIVKALRQKATERPSGRRLTPKLLKFPVNQSGESSAVVGTSTPTTRTFVLATPALFVAVGLRLQLLGARSLWIDEAASITFARLPWRSFLRTLWGYEGNMTLYY